VSGTVEAGGIIGCLGLRSTLSNSFNSGVVSGNSYVGCIVGRNLGGTVINCHYDEQMCYEK
jgi:hypothetical protein